MPWPGLRSHAVPRAKAAPVGCLHGPSIPSQLR